MAAQRIFNKFSDCAIFDVSGFKILNMKIFVCTSLIPEKCKSCNPIVHSKARSHEAQSFADSSMSGLLLQIVRITDIIE